MFEEENQYLDQEPQEKGLEILSEDNQLQVLDKVLPRHLTILPLTQRPVFPGITIPMTFSGPEKVNVIKKAMEEEDGFIGLALASEYNEDNYTESELHEVGTAYQVLRINPIAPGVIQVLGRGINRFRRKSVVTLKPEIRWEVEYYQPPKEKPDQELKAYMMAISSEIKELLQLNPLFKEQVNMVVAQLNYDDPGTTMDVISNLLSSEPKTLAIAAGDFRLVGTRQTAAPNDQGRA